MKILSFLSKKVILWVAGIGLASALAFSGAQCRRIEKLEVENLELRSKNSKLEFQVETKQAEIETHELIRQGPEAIASATDKIKLNIKPKNGATPIPSKVIEDDGVTVITVDPERQAEIVKKAELTESKILRIGELDEEIIEYDRLLKKARRTRMRNTVIGGLIGVGVTIVIVKIISRK